VLPSGFNPDVSVWTALKSPAPGIRGWDREVVGRLREHVSIEQAQQVLSGLLEGIERGRRNPATGVQLRSLYSQTTADYADTVAMFGGAVAFILLIACVNVAGLLLARGGVRRTELAVRAAIGAGRLRLLRQLLTESLLLAAAGGGLGILVAWISLDSLLALLPLRLPTNVEPAMNVQVLGLSVLLSVLTALVAGVLPAIRLSHVDTNTALARGRQTPGLTLTTRSSQLMVGAEVALAVVLLIGGGLLARSLSRLMATEIGIDPGRFVTFDVEPIGINSTVRRNYYAALVDALRALPGVEAAGATSIPPLSGGYGMTGGKVDGGTEAGLIRWDVMPGFLDSIGLPALQGRLPSASDSGQSCVVINETARRTFFGDESPIGRDIQIGGARYEVAAVVGDVRLSGPIRPIEAQAYLFGGSADLGSMTIVVRPEPGVALHAEQLREVAAVIGPGVLIDSVHSGADLLASNSGVATPRQRTILLGLLGAVGLLLTLVGIASVTASAVTRRRNEIGIRVALGATPAGIVMTMMRDMAAPTVMGLIAGLTGGYFATALITAFLFDTAPHDWLTFVAVTLGVCVSALVAAWLPARRAARVDPVVALRTE
jgi:predicted permease